MTNEETKREAASFLLGFSAGLRLTLLGLESSIEPGVLDDRQRAKFITARLGANWAGAVMAALANDLSNGENTVEEVDDFDSRHPHK